MWGGRSWPRLDGEAEPLVAAASWQSRASAPWWRSRAARGRDL